MSEEKKKDEEAIDVMKILEAGGVVMTIATPGKDRTPEIQIAGKADYGLLMQMLSTAVWQVQRRWNQQLDREAAEESMRKQQEQGRKPVIAPRGFKPPPIPGMGSLPKA